MNGLRLVDLPPPPPAIAPAKTAPARGRPKRARQPSVQRRVRAAVPPVIVAAPNPESDFTVPLPEVVAQPAPLLAQEADDIIEPPQPAYSEAEETASSADDAAQLARIAAEEERRRVAEEEQERERIARQQADDEARKTAQLEEQERLARQQLEQQRLLADEQALRARQEQERRAQEAAQAARANDELLRQRAAQEQEAQEQAARQLADQRAAQQAAMQAPAIAQQRAQDEGRRLAQAREQAEIQRLEAQRLAQEQAERQRIEEQHRMAQERARQQADDAARRSAADRLQAQGPGLEQGRGQPEGLGSGVGVGAPGSGSGAGERSQPGALAGMPGSRARELLRGLTIPGASVPAPVAGQGDARRVLADGGERDAPLRLYVDSVRQKLERNAVLGGARLALRDVRIDPLVSLTLRSDGSIDDVTIVRSSGQPDMDEAVRRFVRLNARYSAFPPNVAARFDVIEIRRIWRFTDGLKLLEEMR